MIKIEIWSDFTCPFCYIGKRNLEKALSQFSHHEYVQIEFKSYRLNPSTTSEKEVSIGDMLMERFGLQPEQVNQLAQEIYEQAEKVDLAIHLAGNKSFNTILAHRLTKYAENKGYGQDVINRLFNGYFTKTINLENKADLIDLAVEIGLDKADVDSTLSLNCYAKAVHADEITAVEIGINSVPFYVFNEEHAVSGSQPVEMFLRILEELWKSNEALMKEEKSTKEEKMYCTGNDCERENSVKT